MTDCDVLIVGLGPAGRALAHRASAAGLYVRAIDPQPSRGWSATYGAWADELPDWLPVDVRGRRIGRPSAWALSGHRLPREYVVLDTRRLQDSLGLSGVDVVESRVVSVTEREVLLIDGTVLRSTVVVDARGPGTGGGRTQQTAFGLVVPADDAAPALEGAEAWFMDWRGDNDAGAADPPSFLYAVPLPSGEVLFEETCLVGNPALPLAELRRRLRTRLSNRAVPVPPDAPTETVRFAVDTPPPAWRARRGPFLFGARGGLMHPCTGYSVAAALRAADTAAAAIRSGRFGPAVLWPARARAVHVLRSRGLTALLALGPAQVAEFFEAYFSLPADRQAAFLSGHRDLTGNAAAMAGTFRALPPQLRRTVARSIVVGGGSRRRIRP